MEWDLIDKLKNGGVMTKILLDGEKLKCAGMKESKCDSKVTHIDEKGYIYCSDCGQRRKSSVRCRKLSEKEIEQLNERGFIERY